MFQKIIAAIIAFFVWLFPCLQKTQPLDAKTVASNLMLAIETEDVELFKKQLCRNIKQNVDDLPGKITELFDAIDGDLVDFTWETMGGSFESDGRGKSTSRVILNIEFTTTTGSYLLMGGLEYHNTYQPEEMGMRSILLFDDLASTTPIIQIRTGNAENGWQD